jgi:ABC-type Fe3+-hydroxamate transport system substrate-binding protein
MRYVLLTVAALVALTACSSTTDTATPSTAVTTTNSPTPVMVTPEPMSAREVCAEFVGVRDPNALLTRIPEVLTSLGPTVSEDAMQDMLDIHVELESLIDSAPSDLAAILREVDLPFQQAEDVYNGGGGSLRLDTSAAADGVVELVIQCPDDL